MTGLASAPTAILSTPGAVLALVGVVLAVAGLLVVFRAAYAKAQIEALRGDRDDLMKRTEILEHDNTRLTSELDAAKAKIEILEQLVTGKSAVPEVLKLLAAHDDRITGIVEILRRVDRHTTPAKGS